MQNYLWIEGLIPFTVGLFAILLAWDLIPVKNPEYLEKKKNLLKTVGPCAVLFGIFISYQAMNKSVEGPDLGAVVSAIKQSVTLPKQIDENTRIDDVKVLAPDEMGYFYTLTTVASDDARVPAIHKDLLLNYKANICAQPTTGTMSKYGIKVRMTYNGSDGRPIFNESLNMAECLKKF